MQEVVVVLNGPHVKKWVWALCAWIEVFWAGRISRGVAEALRLEAPLLVCGDANGGEDLRHMVALAQAEGIETVPCENGKEKEHKNTRGDCLAAIREIEQRPDVLRVHLVTCWYHMPRAMARLRHELALALPDRQIVIEPCIVWARFLYGFTHLFPKWDKKAKVWKGGEVRGFLAVLLGRQVGEKSAIGKPDLREVA